MKPQSYIGFHAIAAILSRARVSGTLYLCGTGKRQQQLQELARHARVGIEQVDRNRIERLGGPAARGAVLVGTLAGQPPHTLDQTLERLSTSHRQQAIVLLLDHITDPQNLGAVLRSADQFGVDCVVIPQRRAAPLSEAVMRASSGAAAVVPTVEVANLVRALEQLKDAGFWIYGADMAGRAVDSQRLDGRVALVLGNEAEGLSRLVREHCDVIVRIPTGGTLDSLNVSVSAGVFLYEITRQQQRFR
ncbi:MAG: 23S rRNA (guanosine(2251)-2'-O)-methyltransferase RlmB [Spirochaetaceae bacterium]|nr:MAG: 23S rRNA (guanosine(2251)-2'-O)-methyltransferase RlmB [Spirochaetaceae bacterium]